MTQEVETRPQESVKVSEPEMVSKPVSKTETPDYLAIGGFVLGIINLCAWLVPLCGCPMSLIALGLGIAGLKSTKFKWMGIVAIVLGALGLVLSVGSWLYNMYYYSTYPEMNPLYNL